MGTHRYMTRLAETKQYNLRSKNQKLSIKKNPQDIKIKLKNPKQLKNPNFNLTSKTTTTSTKKNDLTISTALKSTTLPLTKSNTLSKNKHTTLINPYEQYSNTYLLKDWESLERKPWIVQTLLSDSGKCWLVEYIDPITMNLHQTTVNYDDYKRVLFPTDNFNNNLDTLTGEKWNKNFLFLQYMLNHPRENRSVVYLDAESAFTTKYIQSSGLFQSHQLHVPNVNVNFLKKAPKDFQNFATFHLGSLYEWMRDLSIDKCQNGFDVGGDYCCTFEGNQFIKPKADLTLMFQKEILAKKNGVLWLTFSYRCKGGGIQVTKQKITTWIQQISLVCGYKMKLLDIGNYGQMVYCFYVSC